jgi:hypothetical protein
MLEPTMRELLESAGVEEITIQYDEKGIKASGEYRGTERQIRRRLGNDFELNILTTADSPTIIRCRPLN